MASNKGNRDQLANSNQKVDLRAARQAQAYKLINGEDTAATTGRLVNPTAAVIPNPTGAGGEAGAQGAFGYGNPSYMNPNLQPQQVAGNTVTPIPAGPSYTANTNQRVVTGSGQVVTLPKNSTINFGNPISPSAVDVLTGNVAPSSPSGVTGTRGGYVPINNPNGGAVKSSGGYMPSLVPAQNGFAGAQTGGGSQAQSGYPLYANTANNPIRQSIYPQYAGAVQAQQASGYTQNGFNNPHPYRQTAAQLNQTKQNMTGSSYPWGTAGMYTYGSFSNKEEAFLTMMERGVPTNQIPADIADNLGLSTALSDPNSGWKMVNGRWVNQTPDQFNPNNPLGGGSSQSQSANNPKPVGSTDYTSTQFYRDYVANNTPFEQQLRWDGSKYVSVGQYMNRKNKDYSGNREAKIRQRKRIAARSTEADRAGWGNGGGNSGNDYVSSELQNPYQFTGSWGVVSFNTGSG